jgi:CRISPR/Cas system-associated exonuclease Cas4 (RecB family)
LNVRNFTVAGEPDALTGKLRASGNKDANYTQQDAKQIIDRNAADENAAFTKLAERLIQQQDAAVTNPATIQANIPEQGRLLTFSRAVAVDNWADLQLGLKAKAVTSASWLKRLLILAGTALALALFGHSAGIFRRQREGGGATA